MDHYFGLTIAGNEAVVYCSCSWVCFVSMAPAPERPSLVFIGEARRRWQHHQQDQTQGELMTDLTAFICEECRKANQTKITHPGQWHQPGICDCPCKDEP